MDKIKQIIPAPDDLYAVYVTEEKEVIRERVLYIALMENGSTEMHATDESGWIDEVTGIKNFSRIEYGNGYE